MNQNSLLFLLPFIGIITWSVYYYKKKTRHGTDGTHLTKLCEINSAMVLDDLLIHFEINGIGFELKQINKLSKEAQPENTVEVYVLKWDLQRAHTILTGMTRPRKKAS